MKKERSATDRTIEFCTVLFFLFLSAGFMLAGPTQAQAAGTCPTDITSYWMFEETAGSTTFADSVGGHNAACIGSACPGFTDSGRIGNAWTFDGVDDGLNVSSHVSFNWDIAASFSIEFWTKAEITNACIGNQVIIGRNDPSTKLHWWVGCWDKTGIAAFRMNDKSGKGALVFGSTDLTDGRWHHVAAVRDGSAAENYLYVDGILEGSTKVTYSTGFDSATAALNIGYLDTNPFYRFAGTIDEIAVYGRALAEKEIRQHYIDGSVGLGWGYCPDCATSVRIMPLGDSITLGWMPPITDNIYRVGYRQKLNIDLKTGGYNVDFVGGLQAGSAVTPAFDIDHEGHGGWQAKGGTDGGIAPNVNGFLLANPADVVLLHIGTNDIPSGANAADITEILDNVDGYSKDISVVLARIINQTGDPARILATTQFNNAVEEMAKARIANGDKIIIVDQESALDYATDMADAVHPNVAGYEKMSNVWLNALDSFLPVCAEVAPLISSLPVTTAYVGWKYSYNVDATGNPVPGFSFLEFPQGMTINPGSGIIQWVPGAQGNYNVTVKADNGVGLPDTQSFAISVAPPPSCPANITHYWKLDEAGGTSYADFYGGNAASCTDCPTPTTGIVNGALQFDAVSRLNAKDDNTFDWNTGDSFSIDLWVKTDSASTCAGNQVFVGRTDGASLQWWLGCGKTGGVAVFYLQDKAGNYAVARGVKDLTDGSWHHIAATRDAAAGTINVYVDGLLERSVSANYSAGFDSITAPLNIGWLNPSLQFNFVGTIDELAIYGRALSEDEVLQNYSAGSSNLGYCAPLLPSIVSLPVTDAAVGIAYSYNVVAIGNPSPSYSLITHPSGMSMDSGTGLISWTPTSGQVGNNNVKVQAENGSGNTSQSFIINVVLHDIDSDGIPDSSDNCPTVSNPSQTDLDHDGIGDSCDPDIDGDGDINGSDNCSSVYNPDQANSDGDGMGNACDVCPTTKPIKKIGTSIFFDSLQTALDYSSLTNGNVVGCNNADLTEAVNFSQIKTITLRGGYNCAYSTVTSNTRIHGSLKISKGTVTVENIVIQ